MVSLRPQRILGGDIEASRDQADWGDYAFKNFFCGDLRFEGQAKHSFSGFYPDPQAFVDWVAPLREPDIIFVAHNGRYDLDGISGELVRLGEAPLPPMLLSDTLKDGPRRGKMAYGTLAYMCKQYGVQVKGNMDQYDWQQAYRGSRAHQAQVKAYNIGDVICVLQLRRAMLDAGHLSVPKLWKPGR